MRKTCVTHELTRDTAIAKTARRERSHWIGRHLLPARQATCDQFGGVGKGLGEDREGDGEGAGLSAGDSGDVGVVIALVFVYIYILLYAC